MPVMTERDKLVQRFYELYKEIYGHAPKLSWIDFRSDDDIKSMIKDLEVYYVS